MDSVWPWRVSDWLRIKTVGVKSNKTGIGARVVCTTQVDGKAHRQMDEVRSGGSYLSQGDLRVHFGLGEAREAAIEIHWPSGVVDRHEVRQVNRILTAVEGAKM